MKIVMFEGTTEEFEAVAHLFGKLSPSSEESANGHEPTIEPQKAIRNMLSRIDIPNGQLAVYKALVNGRLEYNELLAKTGRVSREMSGVLGALGRRINGTEAIHKAGLPGNTSAVLVREKEGGKEYFSLTPDALEALRAEEVI